MMDTSKYICKLTEEEKELARHELNETDENRADKIEEIRRWLIDNPKIYSRTEDMYILRYLRVSKFDVEKTKARITSYLKIKADHPEWCADVDPLKLEFQEILGQGIYLTLRDVNRENQTVFIDRLGLQDPKRHSIDLMMKVAVAITEVSTRDNESASLNGIACVIDMQGFTLAHALQASPQLLRKIINMMHNSFPLRIKSYVFVNVPQHVFYVIKIFRFFLSEKMKSRLSIHLDDKVLAEKFPKEILPIEYGGTNGPIDNLRDYWKQQIEENRNWLIDNEKYKLST